MYFRWARNLAQGGYNLLPVSSEWYRVLDQPAAGLHQALLQNLASARTAKADSARCFVSVGQVFTVECDPDQYGHLNQALVGSCTSDAGINNSCGGTAAVNSLVFLENRFPAVYENNLIPHTPGNTSQQDQIEAANGLNCHMNCNGNGVPFGRFAAAVLPVGQYP